MAPWSPLRHLGYPSYGSSSCVSRSIGAGDKSPQHIGQMLGAWSRAWGLYRKALIPICSNAIWY